jgi:hypothetical protein
VDLSAYLSNWYGSLGLSGPSLRADTVLFYPNPSSRQFYTNIRSVRPADLRAGVYNEAGQLVLSKTYKLKQAKTLLQ